VSSAGSTLTPGTYWVVVTVRNSFGETLPGVEQEVSVGAGQGIQISCQLYAGLVAIRCYITFPNGGSGNEILYFDSSNPLVNNFVISSLAFVQGIPPTRSTAYLPDSDGQAVGAFAIYRWLNQALAWAAAKNRGGLPDFGAVGTVSGQPIYNMTGYWKKIDSAWYDGYPLGLLAKTNVFRRNPVTGYAGMLEIFQASDRLIVELWPQPSRTSNQSTLAIAMQATDTTATLTSAASYVLGFGMTQIGSEVVNYASIQGNQLLGLTRGMGGTVPSAWGTGTPATELNLQIAGYRVPSTYSVGQSFTTLYLPPGWDEALISYMLYRFRSAEQDDAAAKRYLQEATQKMSDLSANRIIAGPRQITPYGGQGPEIAAGLGSPFGGVIIP